MGENNSQLQQCDPSYTVVASDVGENNSQLHSGLNLMVSDVTAMGLVVS